MTRTVRMLIWGREFDLPVIYDCYEGERVTRKQRQALKTLLSNPLWIENAKCSLEQYCKNDVMSDDGNLKKDNVFSYVKPESVFIKRDKEYPRVALMCKYRYDLEHGIAVVFSGAGEITIGDQEII